MTCGRRIVFEQKGTKPDGSKRWIPVDPDTGQPHKCHKSEQPAGPAPKTAPPAQKGEFKTAYEVQNGLKDRRIMWQWAVGQGVQLATMGVPIDPMKSELENMGVRAEWAETYARRFVAFVDEQIAEEQAGVQA